MRRRLFAWICASSLSLLALGADADIRIVLKDGRVVIVPVSPDEVQSIMLDPGRASAPAGLPPAPISKNLPPAPTFRADSPIAPPLGESTPKAEAPPREAAARPAPPPPPAAAAPATPAGSGRIQVGPSRQIKLPSQAVGVAKPGDVIEIDAGTYRGDVASWNASNITLRGVGGRAKLDADGNNAEGKATWVISGDNVTVENIEFTGSQVPDGNGAGIRAQGNNLKVINCYFHDNQEGILTSIDRPDSTVDIENSEFAREGGNEGRSHHIYIGPIKQLIVRGSYFHDGHIGHLIKTRARESLIIGNRITDEKGTASYEIDVPNGGRTIIAGNLLEKVPGADNSILVAYAMEGPINDNQELYVVNNTFVNRLGRGVFVYSRGPTPAKIINNLFIGAGSVFHGTGELRNNVLAKGPGGAPEIENSLFDSGDVKQQGTKTTSDPGVVDLDGFDWHLTSDSDAIGAGIDPGNVGGLPLLPTAEYVHPSHSKPVSIKAPIDAGAYQHGK